VKHQLWVFRSYTIGENKLRKRWQQACYACPGESEEVLHSTDCEEGAGIALDRLCDFGIGSAGMGASDVER